MDRTQKQRMLKLADFLEQLDPKKFDLNYLVKSDKAQVRDEYGLEDKPEGKVPSKHYVLEEDFCGTAACAIGYCPIVFSRHARYGFDFHSHMWDVVDKNNHELTGMEWAGEFFGVGWGETVFLFSPEAYPEGRRGPKSVARRLRYMVRHNGMPKIDRMKFSEQTHTGLKG
jgi:hypothetical protein